MQNVYFTGKGVFHGMQNVYFTGKGVFHGMQNVYFIHGMQFPGDDCNTYLPNTPPLNVYFTDE